MITLISQMVGCLLIAAGIGAAVGWFLRHPSRNSLDHQGQDLTNLLRTKEQALETTSHDLKVKTSAMQILEQKIMSSETLYSSAQRELIARGERVKTLEAELALRSKRIGNLEAESVAARQRVSEIESILATQTNELRGAQQTCQTAVEARGVMEREVGVLREHIAQLNEGLADRDQLRARLKQLELAQGRVHELEVEQSDREAAHRGALQQLEQSIAARDRRIGEFDATVAAQAEEFQGAQQACRAAEQAREVMEQEVRVLREHIAQLNEGLADRDQLRARIGKLESVQGRVHELEVELSDREAAHRGAIHQLEQAVIERDRRIEELVPVTHLLREKEAAIKEWERTHERTVHDLEVETAKLQEQCAAQEQLRAQQLLNEQRLHERDEQIASLHRELHALQAERHALVKEVRSIPEKDEQIDRLQKRLKELRTTLKATPPSATVPAQPRQNGAGSTASVKPPKGSKPGQVDDLKKIDGIGPVFADTLQKLGTRTFIQIARWKPDDIAKIAKKLATDPDRIKRENWIAAAKKHHYQKYGERI
jgi:predicted flap endonuclease-1-like 5' DNA nuclease